MILHMMQTMNIESNLSNFTVCSIYSTVWYNRTFSEGNAELRMYFLIWLSRIINQVSKGICIVRNRSKTYLLTHCNIIHIFVFRCDRGMCPMWHVNHDVRERNVAVDVLVQYEVAKNIKDMVLLSLGHICVPICLTGILQHTHQDGLYVSGYTAWLFYCQIYTSATLIHISIDMIYIHKLIIFV